MIIDLQKFAASERPYWAELESALNRLESDPSHVMPLPQLRHFHYLYERTSADLARIITFSAEPETRRYLEHLVARAYGEIHETRERQHRLELVPWFMGTLPQTFRRHVRAFWLSLAITMAGCVFGGFAVAFDPDSKAAILPPMFANHQGDPNERVKTEEQGLATPTADHLTGFSAWLMVNNIKVSIKVLAFGMTFGLGTIIELFHNGVILGLVAVDYVLAGQTKFLFGWIMPHGVIEIPAILIAGQAGLMLASALIGWGQRNTMRQRLRAITRDLVTLIFGVALMLVWAGLVEAFFSQYHEPILPYAVKIAFGSVELVLLILFLSRAGRDSVSTTPARSIPHSKTP
ncbi:MAG TPA: stage II sporulation protein M [Verrucomicrobiae bacterium]